MKPPMQYILRLPCNVIKPSVLSVNRSHLLQKVGDSNVINTT